MKNSRFWSFVLIAVIYVLCTVAGVAVYQAVPGEVFWRLLIADVVATAVAFFFSVLFKNASVYDPYWSVQPIIIILAFSLDVKMTGASWLVLIAICIWGVRLTANWAYTFHGMTHQDWRYTMLKEKTGVFYPIVNFLGIHLVPTLVVYGCVLPAVFVLLAAKEGNVLSVISFVVALASVLLQGVSDVCMHRFRKNRTTTFISAGPWKHSRHPNYLAEILFWWSVAALSVSVLGFSLELILGAIANTLLFLFVSIPLADGKQSKKEGFAEYKQRTRMLLPIPKN